MPAIELIEEIQGLIDNIKFLNEALEGYKKDCEEYEDIIARLEKKNKNNIKLIKKLAFERNMLNTNKIIWEGKE